MLLSTVTGVRQKESDRKVREVGGRDTHRERERERERERGKSETRKRRYTQRERDRVNR